jgi:hypothetical protein
MPTAKEHATDGSSLPTMAVGEPMTAMDRDEQAIDTLRAAGTCPAYEKECIGKDGRYVPVLVGAAVLEGIPDTCIAFVLDLTERKRVEDEVRRLDETLEQHIEATDKVGASALLSVPSRKHEHLV